METRVLLIEYQALFRVVNWAKKVKLIQLDFLDSRRLLPTGITGQDESELSEIPGGKLTKATFSVHPCL